MFTLILIGLLGGLITGISPCILPVLPVIFFAGATGAKNASSGSSVAAKRARNLRPYKVIGGLVLSFTIFTLLGSLLINALNLPESTLKIAGLVVLVAVGLGLIFPWVERLLEKPFARLPIRQHKGDRGAFVLGLSLGLLYVPCAGPVLAAITVASATGQIGPDTVALTIAFSIGASAPLLLFALAGRRVSERVKAFRTRARGVRMAGGIVMIILAIALVYDIPQAVQRALPNYTDSLQRKVEDNPAFRPELAKLNDGGNTELSKCESGAKKLNDCGPAQPFEANEWFNTPGNDAIDIDSLKGEVVLIDFWTYSCVNCQRSIPHVVAWDKNYRDAGLNVIGVHTPEFAFEQDVSNVKDAAEKLDITYPVAIDNDYATWTNYRNRYWPAAFLIDAQGTVRYIHLGEGNYGNTETHIRELLSAARPGQPLPKPTDVPESKLTKDRTPETYLNHTRLGPQFASGEIVPDKPTRYEFPKQQQRDTVALSGTWTVGPEHLTAGEEASLALEYRAKNVYLVLGGDGIVTYDINGKQETIDISGAPRLYTIISGKDVDRGRVVVSFTPGVQPYVFTFG